jgi:MYXO-CTERM domain-containing protein
VPVTCVKTRPDGDGGLTTTPYDCNLCRVLDPIPGHGGSGGSAAGGSGGSATAGSGGSATAGSGGSATAGSGGSATAGTAGSHTSTGKGGGMPDDPGGKSSSGCSIVATGGPTPIGWLLVGLGIVLARRRKTT